MAYQRVSANFTRPADTNAYAVGDLVANSTTAGNVVPMTASVNGASVLRKVILRKSGTSVTSASFRVHFFVYTTSISITCANGDNGAFSTNQAANYLGAVDITIDRAFTDGAVGVGVPVIGSELILVNPNVQMLIEARGAYTPASAEVFTATLEMV